MGNERQESADGRNDAHAARWISQGLEDLVCKLGCRDAPKGYDFDIVVVGSGYGGALAAERLSGCVNPETGKPLRLCVLERGREYLSGMFPVSEAELPGHIRISTPGRPNIRGKADGLLDLRLGPDVCALVANGLGGGSLINAGVMAKTTEAVLRSDAWPRKLREGNALSVYYTKAETLLAPGKQGKFKLFGKSPEDFKPLKFQALEKLEPKTFDSAPLSIAIDPGQNSAGIRLEKCINCGDCATGCNHQAKNSLDQNCLVIARRNGAEIYCSATVLRLERMPDGSPGWKLHVVHTDPDLRRRIATLELRARYVILAAGTFGSTEILLKSKSETLNFSPCLGQRFSTNGDLLAVAYNQNMAVNAVVQETEPFDTRCVGPTITGMIDQRSGPHGITIEEFAIPGPLRRLFAEGFTLADTFHRLARKGSTHFNGSGDLDPCGVDPNALKNTQVFGLMGDDGAAGTLGLVPGWSDDSADGAIRVHWSSLRTNDGTTIFDKQVEELRRLVRDAQQGGEVLPNPMWRLLPRELESIVDIPRGPALTVHPLGGCCMADDSRYGVVDDCGRVFNPDGRLDDGVVPSVHDGLVVLDGSVIPCALGINPAFTIAAVALRALDTLREEWLPKSQPNTEHHVGNFAALPPPRPFTLPHYEPTRIKILERMKGVVKLGLDDGNAKEYLVELTMAFRPKRLDELSQSLGRCLEIDDAESRIRIFVPNCYKKLWDKGATEAGFDRAAVFIAPLTGHMLLLDRAASTVLGRTCRALWAWWLNRGMRDVWQRWVSERSRHRKKGWRGRLKRICQYFYFASHAGEARLFEYQLEIGRPIAKAADRFASMKGSPIRGTKKLTYSVACNPWRQLSELELTEFPNLVSRSGCVLELEPKYYARQEKHLVEIVAQRDHATALFELGSFLLCVLRMLLTTHIWSFRLPDTPDGRKPQRLPGRIPGLPAPQINEIEVGTATWPARIRLTRYARRDSKEKSNPVVLIHGFSANGTTFAHPELQPGLAKYLWEKGRDVWILDLRTSSGMPTTSREQWTFEEVAIGDIPAAFAFIQGATQTDKVDVVAHCMGAAMLSMAILDKDYECCKVNDPDENLVMLARARQARPAFLKSIGRVVLSQVGPLVVFAPANIYRAYVVSFIQHFFGDRTFDLRPDEGLTSQLLDRLLASVPYPKSEFRIENPRTPWKRTPFVGTRHRMDAWFGRVLNIENVHRKVLKHIDDMFGTINLNTTFQTIHFARQGMITTYNGRNAFVTPDTLADAGWKQIPILSIHGRENKLADVATVTRMQMLMDAIGSKKYHSLIVDGLGHQDCMIGRDAKNCVFPEILKFLNGLGKYGSEKRSIEDFGGAEEPGPVAEVPWIGPLVGEAVGQAGARKIAVAPNPSLARPSAIAIVPVTEEEGHWRMQGDLREEHITRLDQASSSTGNAVTSNDQRFYEATLTPDSYETDKVLVVLVYDQAPVIGKPPLVAEGLVAPAPDVSRRATRKAINTCIEDASKEELERGLVTRLLHIGPSADRLCFAAGSCQYPAGPLDRTLAGDSYERLHTLLEKDKAISPEFVVLSGDQVYVDPTNGLMDPSLKDDEEYALPYEKFLRAPAVRRVLKRLPVYAMLDDHEIENNWEPGVRDGSDALERREAGKRAYRMFLRPPKSPQQGAIWFKKQMAHLSVLLRGHAHREKVALGGRHRQRGNHG